MTRLALLTAAGALLAVAPADAAQQRHFRTPSKRIA